MQKNSKEKKVWLFTMLLWIINLKIFFLISNWEQTWQIFKYSESFFNFGNNLIKYYYDFATTIPVVSLFLTIIFIFTLFTFWLLYFKVYFYKLPVDNKIINREEGRSKIIVLFATLFGFLGFGCVACGQTLLTSVIFLFVSGGSLFLIEIVGNLVILIGIILLGFGIRKNHKILANKNLCKI